MKDKRFSRRIGGNEARRKRKRAWEDVDCEGVIISTEKCQDNNNVQKSAVAKNSAIGEEYIHHRILPVKEEETMVGDLNDMVDRNTSHHHHVYNCNSDGRRHIFGQNNKCERQLLPMWNQQTIVKTNSDDDSSDSYYNMNKKIDDQEDEYTKRTAVRLKRERGPRPKTEDNENTQENESPPVPPLRVNRLEEEMSSSSRKNNSAEARIERDCHGSGLPFPPTLDLSTLKEVDVPLNWASKYAACRATNRKDYIGVMTLPTTFFYLSSFPLLTSQLLFVFF